LTKEDFFTNDNLLNICQYIHELFWFIYPEKIEIVISKESEDFNYLHIGIGISDLVSLKDLDENYLEECVDRINKRLMFYSEADLLVGTIIVFQKNASYINLLKNRKVLKSEDFLQLSCGERVEGGV
jgi:hypothetical protein